MVTLREILETLPNAYIVGGAVRDNFIGTEIKDYDITTSAMPFEIKKLFPDHYCLGEKFGTIVIKTLDVGDVEVTTMRKDLTTGRHPEIAFTKDINEDLPRRDFRMNAIAFNPLTEEIIDPFNGIKDIHDRIIRTPVDPYITLNEDPLRALRAIRFKIKLGFSLDPKLEEALRNISLDDVSGERIYSELEEMFKIAPVQTLNELKSYGLLKQILPEVDIMDQFEQRKDKHPEGNVWNHTLICLSHLFQNASMLLKLCVLLHDVGKPIAYEDGHYKGHDAAGAPVAEAIMRRWGRPKSEIECVKFCVGNHMKIAHFTELRTAKKVTLCNNPYIDYLVITHDVDCMGRTKESAKDAIYEFIEELNNQVDPFINGDDLRDLGFIPGPIFGTIKSDVYALQVEGIIKSREDAIMYIQERYHDNTDLLKTRKADK